MVKRKDVEKLPLMVEVREKYGEAYSDMLVGIHLRTFGDKRNKPKI